MNKVSKFLLLVLMMVLGFAVVGCGEKEPEQPKEPDPIAPTAITVDATIYSGSETEKYVIAGNKMYVEAMVDGPEGCDETVDWSIDGDAATLEVEDGVAVLTGVKGGNVTVTAKSKIDASVTGSYVAEVVDSEDFNAIVVAAKDAVVAALPEYATANFALPQPENPNVKVSYMSKLKKAWTDGVFQFADAYDEKTGDVTYVFYGVFQFHSVKKEFELSVKAVGDAVNNDFYALSAAKKQVEDMFTVKTINSEFKDIVDNGDGTYQIALPTSLKVEGNTQEIAIEWAVESGSGLSIKNGNQLLYTKPLVDTLCQVNAIYKAKNNNEISKLYLTATGFSPEEVWEYFKTKNFKSSYYNATTDTFACSTAGFTVPTTDTSKKFKALTVEYRIAEGSEGVLTYTAPTGTSTTGTMRKQSAGEATVIATLYYNKSIRTVLVDKFDENGNLVKDEEGNVVQEEKQQLVCDWSKEFTFTITLS